MKALSRCVFVAVFSAWCLGPHLVLADCKQTGPCSCESPEGTIDLSPLDGHSTPRFKDQATTTTDGWLYSWNPCSPFDELKCTGAAGCQVAKDQSSSNTVGKQDTAKFIPDPSTSNIILSYTAVDGSTGDTRTLRVLLMCDPNTEASLTVQGELSSLNYMMTLNSTYCCPRVPQEGGLSGGSILLIVFFCVILVYVVGGVLFMVFVRKASGIEAIPNYSFWSALPGLIKDGTLFTFRRLCALCGGNKSYEKI